MLIRLSIRDIVLINRLDIDFADGLAVLTGETGAGKSILLDAFALALGIVNEAQTAAAVLGHNFPDSRWYRDAHTLLRSGGLEPREDAGSWISRSFRGLTRTVGLSR